MRITIELEVADVERFSRALDRSRRIAQTAEETDILDAAKHALDSLPLARAPGYVRKRIGSVQTLIAMLEDEAWQLPRTERLEVLAALVYFSDPEDLIPDDTEVIGLLDDAIMIEIALRKLKPALRAYARFRRFREASGPPPSDPVLRLEYALRLARKRDRLRPDPDKARRAGS
ncbi:MAG: YkvA family protein [Rudaea sp.]